jgi:hypothetical protein
MMADNRTRCATPRPGNGVLRADATQSGHIEFLVIGCVMGHPLLDTSEFRGPARVALNAAYERVCRELNLSPHPDRLTDIVAETVLNCMRDGQTDMTHMVDCARRALHVAG